MEACDKGQVSVRLRQVYFFNEKLLLIETNSYSTVSYKPSNFTTYVEFVGRVNTDLSINEFVFTNFGDTFGIVP